MQRGKTRFLSAAVLLGWTGLFSACSSPPPQPAAKEAPVTTKPITTEQRVGWYQRCWESFNQKNWSEFRQCYAPNAISSDGTGRSLSGVDEITADAEQFTKSFANGRGDGQLILINGSNIAGIYLLSGTNSGPLKRPDGKESPATGREIGLLYGQVLELAPDALHAMKDFSVFDGGTFASQLGLSKNPARPVVHRHDASPRVVIARNDENETKNLNLDKTAMEAWNNRDQAGYNAVIADDIIVHDMTAPKDKSKTESTEADKSLWKAFSDAKISIASGWAAGDYVVFQGTFSGTNDGAAPALNLKKTGRKVTSPFMSVDRFDNGKIKETWLFYDSASFASQLGIN